MSYIFPIIKANVNQTLQQNHMALHKVLHSHLNITHYGVFNTVLHDSQTEQNAQQDPFSNLPLKCITFQKGKGRKGHV
jgi:hypothetical protein